jgi:hypothetical protein
VWVARPAAIAPTPAPSRTPHVRHLKHLDNPEQHPFQILEHLAIPEPDHLVTLSFQVLLPVHVELFLPCVMPAIQFDN